MYAGYACANADNPGVFIMIRHKCICGLFLLVLLLQTMAISVYASEELEVMESELLDEFDFDELDRSLKNLLPESPYTFEELFVHIRNGEWDEVKSNLVKAISDQCFYELQYHKQTFIRLILIAIIAAVFTNFSNAFQNRQISEISFYVLYLLMLALSLNSFQLAVGSIEKDLEHLLAFMQVLCPTYFLSVAIAVGGNTSIIFFNIILFIIYLVEVLVLSMVMPGIHIYVMIQMINYMTEEESFSGLAELIETFICWSLKGLTGFVIGINVVQRLLAPALDDLKRSVITRGAQAIPAIGGALSGSVELLLSTAIVIKNSIGIAGILICLILMVGPFIKLLFFIVVFKAASAIVQPVSDKRITGVLSGISKGGELLLRAFYTVSVLFLITIAIVASTSHL